MTLGMGQPIRAVRIALPVALSALALVPSGVSAATFGANLGVAPNVDFDCTVTPPVGELQLPTGAQTCTWFTTGRLTDTSEGHGVPYGGGTITRARVRVGPVTGPMQFVVLRSLRHPGSLADPACCFPVGASRVFTPAANAVTAVPMNVGARNDTDKASGINNSDHIAISVLAPGVPVPARYTGDQSLSAPAGGAFYPHYVPGTERTTGLFGVVGFQTLINADLESARPGKARRTAPIALGAKTGRVRGGRALIPLVCTSSRQCAGVLRLQSHGAPKAAAASTRARTKTYGKKRFKIAPGKTMLVKVRLSKAGKRRLRRGRAAVSFVNVTLSSKRVVSKRITLRR